MFLRDHLVLFLIHFYSHFLHIGCFTVYTSCHDVGQKLGSNATDGDYVIFPKKQKFGITIYCAGFSSGNPKEYLTLHAGRSDNYALFYDYIGSETSCGDKSPKVFAKLRGRTEFNKVRFDIDNMKIIQDDFTFTHQIGPTKVSYGTAGDNFASSFECAGRGSFKINLMGTPFVISDSVQWMWTGQFYHTANSSSSHNAKIFKSKYIGCYEDKLDRLLPSLFFESDKMTQGMCVEHCRSRGFRFAGLQYYTQCYCGDMCCKFGKVNDTECNTPCRGNNKQKCGGHWRTSVFGTGDPQSIQGQCGGYPGRCYPTVNGMEGLIVNVVPTHTCAHEPPICLNEAKCIAVTATDHKCQCYPGYSSWDCSLIDETVIVGSSSCPAGFQPEACSCGTKCSGAKFEADTCISASGYPKVTCRYGDPGHVILFNVQGLNSVQCPEGSQITGCTYWDSSGKLKTSDGTANVIQYSSGSCSLVPGCQTCQLQARCKKYDCGCLNKGHCHKVTGQCICKDGYYGNKCESFDYCAFYEDTHNTSACGVAGTCTPVTTQKIKTYGGDNVGDSCLFPFKFQDTSFGYCIESNKVGPPFACGVKFDGSESSYINLGPWSPGPVYTVAAWVRPSGSGKTRRTIAGGISSCRDFGFYYFENFWAYYKGDDYGCSRGIDSGVTIQNGKWYLVATTNNGTHVTIYVNGHTNTVKVKPYLLPTTYGFWIGGEQCCKMGRTKGLIKTVKVWKRALQPTEIANSMKNNGNVNSSIEAQNSGLVGHWELAETISPPCIGTNHGGQDWILEDGEIVSGIHCNISRFVVPKNVVVSLRKWNEEKPTGMLEINAQQVEIYGFIDGSAAGYRGGVVPTGNIDSGIQGESYTGSKTLVNSKNNRGGGGGGLGGSARADKRGQPGGGGGYGTAGTSNSKLKGDRSGVGKFGVVYGDSTLKPSYMGSGGGSGGNAADLTNNTRGGKGGNGGGSITIVAEQSVLIRGVVSVRGEAGQGDVSSNVWCTGCPAACNHLSTVDCYGNSTKACWDMSGPGGGGSGGSIYIEGKLVDIGQTNLWAMGGSGGFGTDQRCGGDGGLGRIRVNAVTFKGTVSPSAGVFTQGTMKNKFQDHSQPGQKVIDYRNTMYGNEVYRGCFRDDNMSNRMLAITVSLTTADKANMTPEHCIDLCRKRNMKYSGTEYGYECFCDNHLNMDMKVADGDCNMPCRGDSKKTCGASFRAQVFGPPPEAPAEGNIGALQTCEPWCITADPYASNPDNQKWGLCSMSSQSSASWDIHCDCPAGYHGLGCNKPCPAGTYGKSCSQNCSCVMNNTAICNPVNGQCLCNAGYMGIHCVTTCPTGTFGTNCTGKCNCSNNAQCDPVSGACVCKPGWYGQHCQFLCPAGTFGVNCSQKCFCNDHGTCNPENTDGTCECEPGYKLPSCADTCDNGDYGPDCSYQCDCNGQPCDMITGMCRCNPGYKGKKCELTCPHGTYGRNCQSQCDCSMGSGTGCDPVTGICHCGPGVVGQYCQNPCLQGIYGIGCQQRCKCVQNQTAYCEPTNGLCHCKPGYIGENCAQACPFGYYGDSCAKECPCKMGAPCNPMTGECICPVGWTGKLCENPCPSGFYGPNCTKNCPDCSSGGGVCNRETGACICQTGQPCKCPAGLIGDKCLTVCDCTHGTCNSNGICQCKSGWTGVRCSTPCQTGYYGVNCQSKCNCVHGLCHTDSGICICEPGYSGMDCSTPCKSGFYGPECKRICPNCRNNAEQACDPKDGSCVCKPGFKGSLCDQECLPGTYGTKCSQKCNCDNGTSYCRNTDGVCKCSDGYTGPRCSQKCQNGFWGPNCTNACKCKNNTISCDHKTGDCICKPGFTGVKCLHTCVLGFWGKDCINQCNCSKDGSDYCSPIDGACQCKPGFSGNQCYTKCPPGKWGKDCINICECNNHGTCDTNNGHCDCDPGYIGNHCEKACKANVYWGKRCANKCDCNGEYCDPRDGTCRCSPGKKGYSCELHCASGYFGFQCAQHCMCKNDAVCDPVNGNCKCQPGWSGKFCDETCPPGMYGVGCTEMCPQCLNGASCDSALGVCKCLPGFTGLDCNQTCPAGSWGYLCQQQCSSQCKKGCQPDTGVCNCEDWTCRNGGVCTDKGICLCSSGYSGYDCNSYIGLAQPLIAQATTNTGVVSLTTSQLVGIAVGVLAVIAIVLVVTVILMRKKYTGRIMGTRGTIKYDGSNVEVDSDSGFSNPLHFDTTMENDDPLQKSRTVPETTTEGPKQSGSISLDTSNA